MSTFDYDLPAGAVGAFIEDLPRLTHAMVRPYIIAILLHRGAVRPSEIMSSLSPHCQSADLKVGGFDDDDETEEYEGTRAEALVDEILGELVGEGVLRYNESQDLWTLTTRDIPRIISWVAALGARMPQHLLSEISHQQVRKVETGFIPWDGADIEPCFANTGRLNRAQGAVDAGYAASYHQVDSGA